LFGSWCNSPWDNSLMHVYRQHTNRYRKLKKSLKNKEWINKNVLNKVSVINAVCINFFNWLEIEVTTNSNSKTKKLKTEKSKQTTFIKLKNNNIKARTFLLIICSSILTLIELLFVSNLIYFFNIFDNANWKKIRQK
jgi:hypothetical protein